MSDAEVSGERIPWWLSCGRHYLWRVSARWNAPEAGPLREQPQFVLGSKGGGEPARKTGPALGEHPRERIQVDGTLEPDLRPWISLVNQPLP